MNIVSNLNYKLLTFENTRLDFSFWWGDDLRGGFFSCHPWLQLVQVSFLWKLCFYEALLCSIMLILADLQSCTVCFFSGQCTVWFAWRWFRAATPRGAPVHEYRGSTPLGVKPGYQQVQTPWWATPKGMFREGSQSPLHQHGRVHPVIHMSRRSTALPQDWPMTMPKFPFQLISKERRVSCPDSWL